MSPASSGSSPRPEGHGRVTTDARRGLSLLVVDDHRIFAEVLSTRLRREPGVTEVRVAFGPDEATVLAGQHQPDVAILDYDLAGVPATALVAELRQGSDPPKVLILSATEEPAAIVDTLAAGAAGWVVKGASVEVLMAAVGEVTRGGTYLHPTTVQGVVERLLQRSAAELAPSFVRDLSARQLQVLQCLAGGLTRVETAQRLFISPNTVRTHVQHLLHVSGEHSTLALVARARDLGVRGIDDPA